MVPSRGDVLKLLIKHSDEDDFTKEYVYTYRESSNFYDLINAEILSHIFWLGRKQMLRKEKMKKLFSKRLK